MQERVNVRARERERERVGCEGGRVRVRERERDSSLKKENLAAELIVKYNICLKTLLQQGILEPAFYGDLDDKFKRIVGKPNFSDH